MSNILVLGDDSSAFLAVVRSLGRGRHTVHAASSRQTAPASQSHFLAGWHRLPKYIGDGAAWQQAIGALHGQLGFDMIVPTSDSSLANVAAHRELFLGAICAVPNDQALCVLSNKQATRKLAASLGISIPPGRSISPGEGAADILRDMRLPAILKQKSSYRSGDEVMKSPVHLVRSGEQLAAALRQSQPDLVETYLPGWCRGVSIIARQGEVLHAFQHRRLRQKHETGPSSYRISERCDPELLEWTKMLAAQTKLTGVAMFEYRYCTDDGRHYLLEVNPRFWGSLPLAVAAGANYPLWLHDLLIGEQAPAGVVQFATGNRKRDHAGEHHNLALSWNSARSVVDYLRLILRLAEFAALMVRGRAFDSWAADDPEPFRAERRKFIRSMRRFVAKRTRRPALGPVKPT
ncbi:MAG: ATP-grasp domain-containing protein [Alteripontixanthobacter sp.]